MIVTFSCGETVVGICACSFSVSQFLRASSSHSACILSQNSVSDWWRGRQEKVREWHAAPVISHHAAFENITSFQLKFDDSSFRDPGSACLGRVCGACRGRPSQSDPLCECARVMNLFISTEACEWRASHDVDPGAERWQVIVAR